MPKYFSEHFKGQENRVGIYPVSEVAFQQSPNLFPAAQNSGEATSFRNSTGFPTEIVSHWTQNPRVHIAHILYDLSKFQMSCFNFQFALVPFHSTVCHSDRPVLIALVFLDCSMIDEHSTLNDGLGEGVSYRYTILEKVKFMHLGHHSEYKSFQPPVPFSQMLHANTKI